MNSISLPFLRRYNYIEDYFETLHRLYSQEYIASYPVTYYSFDMDNSILEDTNLIAGSYEKSQVGELSGAKWNKIYLFPVHGIEQVQPTSDSGEKGGITFRESITTQIVYPSTYGLKPLENDIVDLSFGYKSSSEKIKFLYTVVNFDLAHEGDQFQIYRCRLRPAPFDRTEIDKQISREWMFYEHERSILPIENSQILLNIQQRSINLMDEVSRLFDNKSGFYLLDL